MPAPIDFASPLTSQGINPAASFGQGMQIGGGLLDRQQQQTQNAQQNTQFEQAQQDRAAKMRAQIVASARQAEFLKGLQGAQTADDFVTLHQTFPEFSEQAKAAWGARNDAQKQDHISIAQRSLSAIEGGETQIGIDVLEQAAAAYEAKDPQQAAMLRGIAGVAKGNPSGAARMLKSQWAAVDPPSFEKVYPIISTSASVEAQKAAEASKAKTEADVAAATALDEALAKINLTKEQADRLKAETKNDAARLGFDYYKLAQETATARAALAQTSEKLTPAQEKVINDSVTAGVQADLSAKAAEDLANKFDKASETLGLSGGLAKVDEWLKEALGNTDEMSVIRRQFAAIANQEVLKNLPPGAASDRDVALMREGLPEKTDDPKRISEFLRAQARVTRAVQAMKNTEAEFINQNGSLGPARRDLVIDGKVVPRGMRFDQVVAAQSMRDAPKQGQKYAPDEFQNMSDEELQRIANGG